MNTKLNVFAQCLIELVEVILVLCNLAEEVKRLFDEVLADDLENLVLSDLSSDSLPYSIIIYTNNQLQDRPLWPTSQPYIVPRAQY